MLSETVDATTDAELGEFHVASGHGLRPCVSNSVPAIDMIVGKGAVQNGVRERPLLCGSVGLRRSTPAAQIVGRWAVSTLRRIAAERAA